MRDILRTFKRRELQPTTQVPFCVKLSKAPCCQILENCECQIAKRCLPLPNKSGCSTPTNLLHKSFYFLEQWLYFSGRPLNEITKFVEISFTILIMLHKGSGCGSVVRVVVSDTRGLQFESSHLQNLILNKFTVNCRKDKNKE